MSEESTVPPRWRARFAAIRAFTLADELAKMHPPPLVRVGDGMECWHYPLGVAAGTMYAIRVDVGADRVPTAYLYMAPTTEPDTPVEKRPWWRIW